MITVVGGFEVLILSPKTKEQKEDMDREFDQYNQELEEAGSYWRINERYNVGFNKDVDGAYLDDMFEELEKVCSRLQGIGYELLGEMVVVTFDGFVEMFRMTILSDGKPVKPVLQHLEASFSLV